MKLVRADRIDSIGDYRIVEQPVPAPADGEVLIEVGACGMGYVDALVALGGYQVKPPLPFTPGQEIGGRIAGLGSGVSAFAVGDRVMANSFGGCLAEYVVLPAATVSAIPDRMSFAQAAIFPVNYLTAWHALSDRANLQTGERLLVLGAAGGVGTAAVQIGRLLGAHVIAAASTEEKRRFALANGANEAIGTTTEGWRDRVKAACGGRGPDVVFDPVCGPLFEATFRSLAWRGRHLVIGFAGGPIPSLPVNLALMKGAALVGADVRQFLLFEQPLARRHLATMLEYVSQGALVPPVGRTFAFEAFAEAMTFAMAGNGTGKAVIDVML